MYALLAKVRGFCLEVGNAWTQLKRCDMNKFPLLTDADGAFSLVNKSAPSNGSTDFYEPVLVAVDQTILNRYRSA